jgi:hypothetical protein
VGASRDNFFWWGTDRRFWQFLGDNLSEEKTGNRRRGETNAAPPSEEKVRTHTILVDVRVARRARKRGAAARNSRAVLPRYLFVFSRLEGPKKTNKQKPGRSRVFAREGGGEWTLTWTLVALRAATEPAKEEAMQAILIELVEEKVWLCVREWRTDGSDLVLLEAKKN